MSNVPHHAAHAGTESHPSDHHGAHGDHVSEFRRLFWMMLLLGIPTVAFSGMFAMIVGYTVPEFPGSRWVGLQPDRGVAGGRCAGPVGFVMPMSVGAILMSLSTVVVALNAQLLRRLDPRPQAGVAAVRRRGFFKNLARLCANPTLTVFPVRNG